MPCWSNARVLLKAGSLFPSSLPWLSGILSSLQREWVAQLGQQTPAGQQNPAFCTKRQPSAREPASPGLPCSRLKCHGHLGGWRASPAEITATGLLAQTRQCSQMQQIWCHRGHKHQKHHFIAQSGIGRLGSCFKNIFFSSLEIICPYESLVTGGIRA